MELSDQWRNWASELNAVDPDVLVFPQRCFEFSCGNIVVEQHLADVGTTVWDSEVVMAHLIDELGGYLNGKCVIELGAGTGIAGLVAAKHGARVVLTELGHVVPATAVRLFLYDDC